MLQKFEEGGLARRGEEESGFNIVLGQIPFEEEDHGLLGDLVAVIFRRFFVFPPGVYVKWRVPKASVVDLRPAEDDAVLEVEVREKCGLGGDVLLDELCIFKIDGSDLLQLGKDLAPELRQAAAADADPDLAVFVGAPNERQKRCLLFSGNPIEGIPVQKIAAGGAVQHVRKLSGDLEADEFLPAVSGKRRLYGKRGLVVGVLHGDKAFLPAIAGLLPGDGLVPGCFEQAVQDLPGERETVGDAVPSRLRVIEIDISGGFPLKTGEHGEDDRNRTRNDLQNPHAQ